MLRRPLRAAPADWADWEPLSGSSRDFTTTMRQQAADFPAASVATDSVGGSAVGVQSGASTFLAPQTPPGETYGSSQGRPYLNLRPNGVNAAPPSTTVYTFERPTPAAGWTFVLGDIDADAVTVSATGAGGSETDGGQARVPRHLQLPRVRGVAEAVLQRARQRRDGPADLGSGDRDADRRRHRHRRRSAWFEPTAAIKTMTFVFARTSGSPVYQAWFSALAYDLAGTVSAPEGREQGITLRLLDGDGQVIAETETDADGGYNFAGYAAYDDYRVEVVPPAGLVVDGPATRDADLSDGDQAEVDFVLTEPAEVTGSISGTVITDGGDTVPGAVTTVTGPEGLERTATTDDNGDYRLDELPPGDYAVAVTPPDGYEPAGPVEADVTIDVEVTAVTEVDFTLTRTEQPAYDISGTVEDESGDPVEEIALELTGPGTEPVVVCTDADGEFVFPDVPAGEGYELTIDPLEDAEVVGELTVTVDVVDRDVTGIAFTLDLGEPTPTPTEPGPTPTEPGPTPTEPEPTPGEPTRGPGEPSEAPDPDDELPQTGAPSLLPVLAGLAVILLGVTLLRRRGR